MRYIRVLVVLFIVLILGLGGYYYTHFGEKSGVVEVSTLPKELTSVAKTQQSVNYLSDFLLGSMFVSRDKCTTVYNKFPFVLAIANVIKARVEKIYFVDKKNAYLVVSALTDPKKKYVLKMVGEGEAKNQTVYRCDDKTLVPPTAISVGDKVVYPNNFSDIKFLESFYSKINGKAVELTLGDSYATNFTVDSVGIPILHRIVYTE